MSGISLDCVAQDAYSVLNLAIYGLQGALMSSGMAEDADGDPYYKIDESDFDVMYGTLEAIRSARDELGRVLQTV